MATVLVDVVSDVARASVLLIEARIILRLYVIKATLSLVQNKVFWEEALHAQIAMSIVEEDIADLDEKCLASLAVV